MKVHRPARRWSSPGVIVPNASIMMLLLPPSLLLASGALPIAVAAAASSSSFAASSSFSSHPAGPFAGGRGEEEEEENNSSVWLSSSPEGRGEPLSSPLLGRFLSAAERDFADLNALFRGTIVKLPDVFVQTEIWPSTFNLWLTNIRCFDIDVHDLKVSYAMAADNKKLSFNVDIKGLDLDCDANWRYSWGVFHDGGRAEFRSDDSDASTVIGFTSHDFRSHPPHASKVDSCVPTIRISDINILDGDFLSKAANFFEGTFRGRVATLIGGKVCEELGGMGSQAVSDMLGVVSDMIDGYLGELSPELADPMHAERSVDVPGGVELLDLSYDADGAEGGGLMASVGSFIDMAKRQVDDLLGSEVDDPASPKGTGKDLGVNKLLRSHLLDSERAFVVPVSDWPESVLADGGKVMDSHDMLTQTSMYLTNVKVLGLDTFTEVDLLDVVGKHTVSNRFRLEHLSFEVDLKVVMKPSSSSDSIIVDTNADEVIENIQIKSSVTDLRTSISFLLALDAVSLGALQLGSVMRFDNMAPCLLSSIYALELTELDVEVEDIEEPSISGFISTGIDHVLRTSARAAFEMYESSLTDAVPNFFQMTVREMVNGVATSYLADPANVDCPTYQGDGQGQGEATIDFRDFFLPPAQAKALGASGAAPYGDLGYTLMNLLQSQLLATDEDGYLAMNSALIRPLTESQSGVAGSLSFPGEVFTLVKHEVPDVLWRAFATRMELSGNNARARNLDTMRPPVSVLTPASVDGRMLMNNINFGDASSSSDRKEDRHIGGSMHFVLDIDDANSPLYMRNEVDIGLSVASTGVFADLMAYVSERGVMEFPLEHVMDGRCWLAAIAPPRLDENGLRIEDDDGAGGGGGGVSLSELALLLWSTALSVECVDCSSPGVLSIPRVLADYEDAGTVDKLRQRLVDEAVNLAKSPWLQKQFDRMVIDAPRGCPYHPSYDPDFVPPPFAAYEGAFADSSPLSREALELIAFAGGAAVGLVGVAGAESHLAMAPGATDPLSGQEELDAVLAGGAEEEGGGGGDADVVARNNLLSFTDLGGYVETALDDLRAGLGSYVDDPDGPKANATGEDLLINVLLRSELLDEDRALKIDVNKSADNAAGIAIGLDCVRIFGLDTFTHFDVLDVVANQTFTNEVRLDTVAVELDVIVDMTPNSDEDTLEHMLWRLTIHDLDATAAVLLAIDLDRLGGLPLGSVLHARHVVGCLLSAVVDMEVTQLNATLGDIEEPTFTGFVSDTMKEDVSEALGAVLAKYKTTMLDSAPNLFGVTIRHIVNNIADSYLFEEMKEPGKYCPKPVLPDVFSGYVDFRDLILPPAQAAAAGGRGTSPYGDLASKLINVVDERLLSAADGDGTPKVNDAVIRPFTLEQSGTEGTFAFDDDLAHLAAEVDFAGVTGLEFRASDAEVSNLDTFGYPLELLMPSESIPFVVDNTATIGVGQPLRGTIRLRFEVSGDPLLAAYNELDLGVDVNTAGVFAAILARMDERAFLNFPLRDLTVVDCWLATMPTPLLDGMGVRVDDGRGEDGGATVEYGLTLDEFLLSIASLKFDITCANCTTTGLRDMPEIMQTLDDAGTIPKWTEGLVGFAEEVLQSDLVQVVVDRKLASAPRLCPHDAAYEEGYVPPEYDGAAVPFRLSRDAVEFVIYSGTVAVQTAVVVVAKTHSSYETEVQDPLSGQKALDAAPPDDVKLLDLDDLGSYLGSWADTVLEEASGFFSGKVKGDDGEEDLAANEFLRKSVLDEDGALALTFTDVSVEAGGVLVSLESARVVGLDTFTNFDALRVIGSQTLLNTFQLKEVGAEVTIAIDMDPSTPGNTEYMTLGLSMTDIDVTLAALLALDVDRLGNLTLGSILRMEQILPCVLSAMHAADLTQLSVSVGDIAEPTIDGFVSTDVRKSIAEATRAIFDRYKPDMVGGMPNFFDVTVRAVLNNLLDEYMDEESSVSCPPLAASSSPEDDEGAAAVLDLRDLLLPESEALSLGGAGTSPYGDLFRTIKALVDEHVLAVDPTTGLSKVNDMVIGPLTRGQSNVTGMLHYPNDLVGGKKRIKVGGFAADVEFRLDNVRVEHVDTVGRPLEVLRPIGSDPNVLNNTAAIGVGDAPLRLTLSLLVALETDDGLGMRNEFDLGVDLESAMVMLEALVKISERPFLDFPLRDLTNLHCWLATVDAPPLDAYGVRAATGSSPTLALRRLAASVQRLQLRIECIDCSSPGLRDMSELLASPEAVEDATDTANRVLDYVSGLLGGKFMQIKLDRMLNEAAARCPHTREYEPKFDGFTYQAFEAPDTEESDLSFFIAMLAVAAVIFLVATVVYFAVTWVVRRRHRRWLKTRTEEEVFHIHMSQMHEEKLEKQLCRRTKSMATSPVIPLALRVLMPIVILGNIAFFLSGHLSKGATVSIKLNLGGDEVIIEDFFVFSMARSTVDMWKAGAKELAMLILIFSGIWPYTKQLVTLFLWFAPPSWVSVSRRESIFVWLDVLGKWSMVDIFVLLVALAAFRVSITSPEVAFLTEDFYSLDLAVIPLWGLYANMTAQLISQVSSHFIIYYHRKIVRAAAKEQEEERERRLSYSTPMLYSDGSEMTSSDGEASSGANSQQLTEDDHLEALREHNFELTCDREGRGAAVRPWIKDHVPPVAAVLILALIIWGCVWTSFSLEVHGVVGLAIESGQRFRQAQKEYNLFSMARALMDQARFLDIGRYYLGLGILASLLVITVLIVPLLQAAALLYIWFRKLTDANRRFAAATVEVLQAWQYVEVYILSIIVGAWQIGGISGFMVNDYCGALEDIFAELAYYGIIAESDAQCFRVDAKLEGACFVLLVAAIVLGSLNHFVMKALKQQRRDLESTKVERVVFKEGTTFADEELNASSRASKIKPIPPQFTDTYRWLTVVSETFEPSPFHGNASTLNLDVTVASIKESPTQSMSDQSRDGSDERYFDSAHSPDVNAAADFVPESPSSDGSEDSLCLSSTNSSDLDVNTDSVLESPAQKAVVGHPPRDCSEGYIL